MIIDTVIYLYFFVYFSESLINNFNKSFFNQSHMHHTVRCFLFNEHGKFILVKHKGKNRWVLPGWHIENDENIVKALKREVKEELWVKIKILWHTLDLEVENLKEYPTPICMYKIEYKKKDDKKEKRYEYIFLAQIKSWEIIKTPIDEISDYKYFSVDEIEKLENTYLQIKEIAKKISK